MNSVKLDISLSLGLHVAIIATILAAGSLSHVRKFNTGEIIRVTLTAGPAEKLSPVMTQAKPSAPVIEPAVPISTGTKALPSKKAVKPAEKPKPSRVRRGEEARFEAERAENEIQSDATSAGSPFAGAVVDNPDFNYGYWFEQAFTKIQSNWTNPVEVDGAIVCVIYFQVIKSGRLTESRVETSSGIQAFDQGCLAAVQRSAPFPALPEEFRDEIIGITLPFKYQPR